MPTKLVHDDVVNRLRTINPTIKIVGKYSRSGSPLECECLQCAHAWFPSWERLQQGHGCPVCASIRGHAKLQKPLSAILAWVRQRKLPVKVLGLHRSAKLRLQCECTKCHFLWSPIWSNLQHGSGCPECARRRTGQRLQLTHAEVVKRLHAIHPSIKLVGRYTNAHVSVLCKCNKGHVWKSKWNYLQQGHGCQQCAGQIVDVHFIRAELKQRKINLLGEYVNNITPMRCQCAVCKHIWDSKWKNLQQGCGCPRCGLAKVASFKSEKQVRAIFELVTKRKFPPTIPNEVPWLNGLTLDGYCPELVSTKHPNGVAFERQGEHHTRLHRFNDFNPQKLRVQRRIDARKRVQCWRHGVKLISVPHWVRNLEKYIESRVQL